MGSCRALALGGALALLVSPGGAGLGRLFASADACGCHLGAACPRCQARRAHEGGRKPCPCGLEQQRAPSSPAPLSEASIDPMCLGPALAIEVVPRAPAFGTPHAIVAVWSPAVPRRPPRA